MSNAKESIFMVSSSISNDPLLINSPLFVTLLLLIKRFFRCKNMIPANSTIAAITKDKDIKR